MYSKILKTLEFISQFWRILMLIIWFEWYFSLDGWQSVRVSAADATHASRLSTAVIQSAWRELTLSFHVRDRRSIKSVVTDPELSSQNRWLQEIWQFLCSLIAILYQ